MASHEHEPDIPPRLEEALRRAYEATPPDAAFDFEVVAAVRRRPWLVRPFLMRHGPMAAALVLACGLAVMFTIQTPRDPMDLTGDGVIDVLDALALSNSIERGAGQRDLNGDGLVDGRDVGVVMSSIVRLDGSEG